MSRVQAQGGLWSGQPKLWLVWRGTSHMVDRERAILSRFSVPQLCLVMLRCLSRQRDDAAVAVPTLSSLSVCGQPGRVSELAICRYLD